MKLRSTSSSCVLSIILCGIVAGKVGASSAYSNDDPTVNEDLEVASLFTSMAPKSTTLYICDASLGGIEYQPPGAINCDTEPEDNDTVSVVDITVYFNDLTHHAIKGFECTGWTDKGEVAASWFSAWTKLERVSIDVTPEQCWKMISEKVDPQNKKLHLVTEEVWKTKNELVMEGAPWYAITYSQKREVSNYRVQEVSVGITETDGTVKSIAATVKPCHYNETYCKTEYGILVWRSADVRTCRLMEGEKSNCLFRIGNDGKTLTCPDLKLVLRDVNYVRMCDVWFGASHGVYFLQNKRGQINKQMATPQRVKNMLTNPRKKREIQTPKIHPFEAEIKLNLNYLYDTMRNHTKEVLRKLERDICEVTKRQIEMISTIAQSGHPSLTMKYMYNVPSLRAEYVGDLLQIYQCIEITEWMLLERVECTFEWPIKYVFRHQIYHGFIEPITHTIAPVATKRAVNPSGGCKKFYFQAKNYVALLVKDKAFKVTVDVLPFPSAGKHGHSFMPDLTFVPTGNLAESADEKYESVLKVLRSTGLRDESFKTNPFITGGTAITIKQSKLAFLDGISTLFTDFFNTIISGLASLFEYVLQFLLWGFVLFLSGLLLLVLLKTQVLFAILKLPLRLAKTFCKVCWKNSCRRQIKKLVRSRKIQEYDFEHKSKSIWY